MQQSLSTEMESVLSTESFKVNCCSVLKEMAVSCDLTDMEKVWDLLTVDRRIILITYALGVVCKFII